MSVDNIESIAKIDILIDRLTAQRELSRNGAECKELAAQIAALQLRRDKIQEDRNE